MDLSDRKVTNLMFDQKVTSELSERGKKNTQGIWGIVYHKAQVHHSEMTAAGSKPR